MIWNEAKMDTLYFDSVAATGDPCVVKIADGKIRVEYTYCGKMCVYQGKEVSEGHFELDGPAAGDKATLHQFKGSTILEGSWREKDEGDVRYMGMWRIHLA